MSETWCVTTKRVGDDPAESCWPTREACTAVEARVAASTDTFLASACSTERPKKAEETSTPSFRAPLDTRTWFERNETLIVGSAVGLVAAAAVAVALLVIMRGAKDGRRAATNIAVWSLTAVAIAMAGVAASNYLHWISIADHLRSLR